MPKSGNNKRTSWHVFMINLDRSSDRLAKQTQQLDRLALPFTRVVAIDGQDILPELDGLNRKGYERRHGKSINPNEVGCYLSHYKAIGEFMKSEYDFALILEDDAKLDDDTGKVIEALIEVEGDWDVVNLGGRRNGKPVPCRKLTDRHNLVSYLFRQTGAAGYLINRTAGQKYLDMLLPMKVPYDHEFDRAWIYDFKFRGVEPKVIKGALERNSTIGYKNRTANSAVRKPQWKRGSVFLYRGLNESARLTHYLIRGLFLPRS